jgi:3-oxoacyl-[acyl-carrier protein] reductase
VAIVTGAGAGIGRGIAERFAQEGARVIVAERNRENGAAVAKKIRNANQDGTFVEVDVSSPDAVRRMTELTLESHGRIDVLLQQCRSNFAR